MASFNRVTLMGNLTRDPQVKQLPNTTVAEFGLAMNRKYRTAAGEDREEVTFVDCSAFSKQAELIGQYFQKGHPILIEGRLKFDSWEDNGGGKRSKLTVVVEHFSFLPGGRGGDQREGDDVPGSTEGPDTRRQMFDRPRPATGSRPPAGNRGPAAAPPQQAASPVAEEPQFQEADIPF